MEEGYLELVELGSIGGDKQWFSEDNSEVDTAGGKPVASHYKVILLHERV